MDLAAAKRIYNGIFLAHLLLAAQLVAAGETAQLCYCTFGVQLVRDQAGTSALLFARSATQPASIACQYTQQLVYGPIKLTASKAAFPASKDFGAARQCCFSIT
jgi:hypothetical protein